MKSVILVALALVAVAAALPAENAPEGIIHEEFNQEPAGGYNFAYETEGGSSRSETGELKEALDEENKPHTVITVRGTYSYNDKDGNKESVTYFADETGFHAEGPSIPKPVQS